MKKASRQEVKPKMSKAEAGRLGGMATKQRHGTEHYRAAGRKGAEATLARHGAEHMRAIGRHGFERMAEAYFADSPNPRQSGVVYLRGRGVFPPDPALGCPPEEIRAKVEALRAQAPPVRPKTIEERQRDLAQARAILARHRKREEEPTRE